MRRAEPVARLEALAVGPTLGQPLVEAIDWELRAGRIALVVGATGAGKSALLRTLGLLQPPLDGTYRFCGEAVAGADLATRASLRRRIGLALPELPWLEEASVGANLALPLRVHDLAASELAAVVSDFVDWLGLAARADAPLRTFSSGERRLLGIARAAVSRPDLFLADEPFAGLDQTAASRVVRLLQELARQGAAVVVAVADGHGTEALGGETWRIDGRRLRPADAAALRLTG